MDWISTSDLSKVTSIIKNKIKKNVFFFKKINPLSFRTLPWNIQTRLVGSGTETEAQLMKESSLRAPNCGEGAELIRGGAFMMISARLLVMALKSGTEAWHK